MEFGGDKIIEGFFQPWFKNSNEAVWQMTLLRLKFPQKGFLDDNITHFKSISNTIYQGKLSGLI